MKKRSIALAALSALALSAGLGAGANAAELSLTLTGLKEGGTLYVSLQTKEQFMSQSGVAGDMVNDIAGGDVTVTLDNVPEGTYALSIWHDLNDNNEFDMAPEGWPEDGWATYKGTKLMGTPQFGQVSFELTAEGKSVSEPMIYPEYYTGQ